MSTSGARRGGRNAGRTMDLLEAARTELERKEKQLATAIQWLALLSNRYTAVEQARRYKSETSMEMETLAMFLAEVRGDRTL